MKHYVSLIIMLILSISLFAQWSSDANENLKVSNFSGEEVIPKIDYAPNGDVWVSWFSLEDGNYNVRIQRFNFAGEAQFSQEGLLVSNHPQMSWLTDWDMEVDSNNNAVLSFLDVRNTVQDIFVYKIDEEGNFVWGEDGINLSNDDTEDFTPTVTITSENNVIVTWFAETDIKLQKILSDGSLVLDEPMLFHEDGLSYSWPQILPLENDGFVMKFNKDQGPFYAVTRHVFAQKYDANLNPVWENPVVITDEGGIASWTQIFGMQSDGDGGFVISWHEDRDNNNLSDAYVQHVLSDGSMAFTQDGIKVTTTNGIQQFDTKVTFDSETEDTYIAWMETDADQNSRGLKIQKINSLGERLFSEDGMSIIPLGNENPSVIGIEYVNQSLVVTFSSSINGSPVFNDIRAFKVDSEGNYLWEDDFVSLSNVESQVSHPSHTFFQDNQMLVVWEDSRNENANIYIQNLNLDGTIGQPSTISGISGNVVLNGGEGNIQNVQISINDEIYSPDSNGYYFVELQPGTYTLEATLENYESVYLDDIAVLEGVITEDINITLNYIPQPSGISGIISLDGGTGNIEDVNIEVEDNVYHPDENGNYFIELEAGTYTISAHLENYESVTIEDILVESETITENINITLIYNVDNNHETQLIERATCENFPNPFNPSTSIKFSLVNEGQTSLKIYNVKGQLVKNVLDSYLTKGQHSVEWNGTDENGESVGSGIYLYVLEGKNLHIAKRMTLMK